MISTMYSWRYQAPGSARRSTGSGCEVGLFLCADGCGGQGFARTASAEAIKKTLEGAGFSTMMYYQID